MKKNGILLSVIIFTLMLTNCEKNETEESSQDLLTGRWKLTGLVNKSDEQKYLDTILEILEDKTYSNTEDTGENIVSGTCLQQENSNAITLTSGLFEEYSVDYKIIKNDSDSLILEHHYTLDDKDGYIEYHYKVLK